MTLRNFLIFTFIFSTVCFAGSYIFAKKAGLKNSNEAAKFLFDSYVAKDFAIEVAQEVKMPKQELNTLIVDVGSQNVKVQSAGGDEVIIKLNGKILSGAKEKALPQIIRTELTKDSIKVSINEEALRTVIDSQGNGRHFHFSINGFMFEGGVDLEIFLPREIKKLELRSQSGDFKIQKGEYEVAFVQTQSGDVKLDGPKLDEFEFDLSSGDLRGDLETNDFKGQTSSGDIRVKVKGEKPQIDIRSSSGEVRLKIKKESNFKLQTNTSSGDLRIFGDDKDDEHVFEATFGAGEGLVKVETSSGDIRVSED